MSYKLGVTRPKNTPKSIFINFEDGNLGSRWNSILIQGSNESPILNKFSNLNIFSQFHWVIEKLLFEDELQWGYKLGVTRPKNDQKSIFFNFEDMDGTR